MNNFIMFCGIPCQGKSTFIKDHQLAITDKYGAVASISSDDIIDEVAKELGLTYSEVFRDAIDLATKYSDTMVGLLSLMQKSFILDQTNLTPKARKRKLGLLVHPNNYQKIAVVFNSTEHDEVLKRLAIRGEETGKKIPAEVIQSMKESFVYPTLEEGFNKIMTVEEFQATLPEASTEEPKPKYGEMKFA